MKRIIDIAEAGMRQPSVRPGGLHGRSLASNRSGGSQRALSLAEQIANDISQAILRGDLEPGQRILEQEVSAAFQVSRGPVREALRILESEGLVHILPRRGARVTVLSVKEIDDIYDIRASLLELATRRFVELNDPGAIVELRGLIQRLRALVPYDDRTYEYANVSYEVTMLIVSRCGNDRLRVMIDSLARQTIRYTKLAITVRKRREQSAQAWERLLDATTLGQVDAAAEAARQLVMDAHQAAVATIQSHAEGAV